MSKTALPQPWRSRIPGIAGLLLTAAAVAQAPDADGGALARLRAAWSEYQAAEASFHAATAEARRARDAAARVDAKAAGARYLEAVKEPQEELMAQQRAFVRCFAEVGFDALDFEADRRLLLAGLSGAGADLVERDPVRAIGMSEALLSHYPQTDEAWRAIESDLWRAQVAAGRIDAGIATYRRLLASLPEPDRKLRLRLILGDLEAARGDTEIAREIWSAALDELAGAPGDSTTPLLLPAFQQRLAVVGRPAPALRSETWIGADARPLAELRGAVVILDFWASWCEPCREVMSGLDDLFAARRADGLEVLGVTRFHEVGYLPANREQLRDGGEPLTELDAGSFRQHLVDFRRNAGIGYPFVVGDAADFEAFAVEGIPTVAIVDRDGRVAMLVTGAGRSMLVRAVVERLLRD